MVNLKQPLRLIPTIARNQQKMKACLGVLLLVGLVQVPVQGQFAGILVHGGDCKTQFYDPNYSKQKRGVVDLGLKSFYYSATAKLGGRNFIIGGSSDKNAAHPVKTVQIYDALTNKTTAGPDMLTARALHTAVASGDAVMVCGGKSSLSQILNTCEVWRAATGWTLMNKTLPQPIHSHGAAVIEGDIYLFGGNTPNGPTQLTNTYSSLYGFRPSWPMNVPRADFATTVIDGHVIACGGFKNQQNQTVLRDCETMDNYSATWTTTTSMAEAKHYQNMVNHDGFTYILGGFSDFLGDSTDNVEWYSLRANASFTEGLMETSCGGAVAFSLML